MGGLRPGPANFPADLNKISKATRQQLRVQVAHLGVGIVAFVGIRWHPPGSIVWCCKAEACQDGACGVQASGVSGGAKHQAGQEGLTQGGRVGGMQGNERERWTLVIVCKDGKN